MNAPNLATLRRRCEQAVPHPDPPEMCRLAEQVVDWVVRHHASLPEQPVGNFAGRAEMEARLGEPPPEQGRDLASVLARFDRDVSALAFRINHPRFFAFIPGAPSFPAVLGDWLCSATNFFAGVWLEAAGPAQVELVVLDWFRDFLDLPVSTAGILTGGGSEANLTALVVARDQLAAADRRPLVRALVVGVAFFVVFVAVQWPWADFMMSPSARNAFFGSGYVDFATPDCSASSDSDRL